MIGIPKRYSLQMTGMNGKKDRKYGSAATNAAGVLHLGTMKLLNKYKIMLHRQ